MRKTYILLSKCLLLMSLFVVLIACTKVTQENYTKLQVGMSMQQVIAILGEPTDSKSADIMGVSVTSADWKSQGVEIDIQFLNDQVEIKSFSKPEMKQPGVSGINNTSLGIPASSNN